MAKKSPNDDASAALALQDVLLPLARLMIRGGLGAGELIESMKRSYVRAAIDEVIPAGRRINVSRLAVVTGLTRKEIAAILTARPVSPIPPPRKKSLEQRAFRVLRAWRVDPLFQRQNGRSADLPLRGEPASFSELVKKHGGDVTPLSVLRELERMKTVAKTRTGKLRMRPAETPSRADAMAQLSEFAALVRDFAASAQRSYKASDPPVFFGFKDVKVSTTAQAALFQRVFSKRGAGLLDSVDQWMKHQGAKKSNAEEPSAGSRVGIGIYLVQEDESQSSAKRRRQSSHSAPKDHSV